MVLRGEQFGRRELQSDEMNLRNSRREQLNFYLKNTKLAGLETVCFLKHSFGSVWKPK